jgi:hypothetical protein
MKKDKSCKNKKKPAPQSAFFGIPYVYNHFVGRGQRTQPRHAEPTVGAQGVRD